MKIAKFLTLTLLALTLNSCSGDDSSPVDNPQESQYAMTAKINGTLHNMKAPFGGNEATMGGFTQYSDEEYLHLQGWPIDLPFAAMEVTMYINRGNLEPGTYPISHGDVEADNHIYFIDNTDDEFADMVDGSITITEVNTTAKTIKGTFWFKTSNEGWVENPIINNNVTDGTFNYKYDVED
jgi:hypothetical protein